MATNDPRSIFITGLRNAHAMERQAQELTERQSERLTDYPEVQQRVRQHLDETKEQIRRLDQCLESLGESRSALKDAGLSFLGNMMAGSHAMAADEILKNSFGNYAFEHYEIAAYKSLLVMAEQLGMESARSLLQQSLREEQNMAKWIDDHLRDVTIQYMRHEELEAAR